MFFCLLAVLSLAALGSAERYLQGTNSNETEAIAFLNRYNIETRSQCRVGVLAVWKYITNLTETNKNADIAESQRWRVFRKEMWRQATSFAWKNLTDPLVRRQFQKLAVLDDVFLPKDEYAEFFRIADEMKDIYSQAKVDNLSLDPDLTRIFASSRNPEDLKKYWVGWRDATGKKIRSQYIKFVELSNEAARANGFNDRDELWREPYESLTFEDDMAEQWEILRPFYLEMHAYVRMKLVKLYGEKVVKPDGPIPAHLLGTIRTFEHSLGFHANSRLPRCTLSCPLELSLLPKIPPSECVNGAGNMWGESWNHLQDITRPFPDKQDVDITPEMVRRDHSFGHRLRMETATANVSKLYRLFDVLLCNLTAIQMFKISEDFFTSLGMKRMTPEFWHYSELEKPEDRDMDCYTVAWDMCADDDFRIKHCTVPTQEDLVLVHHMMGNIQYYQHYANQPDVFQRGANPGFHEAIGEVLELSVVTPKHLHKIGFLDKVRTDTESEINFLMSMALEKIAYLPFSYLIDLWRWDVFRGSVDNLNDRWWQLRHQYQGLCPPVRRSETDFDPGSKYDVPGNYPLIRHFFSYILQFQLQEVLCREAGHVGPLHTCDIYGSHAAGDKFAGLLRLGGSMPWHDALARMTGGSGKLDARPLLNYFAPLRRHIRDSLGNSTVGWTSGDHNICP
ncbi:hypothetical protein LAZ67_1004324 [Cordylochernes scorpioides]|uniref:Angiotensin-converting enzyme n=1 Tax=Cordylochernes scorpioides TaxID=51811 RepID=A0ABY6JYW5_9ARAC|nr:hypothetical protein LAZ67_1004324 [Cordylochernes scorpioides]